MPNKIALVTGANKGIGHATAARLGRLGFTVLVGARDAARGVQAVAALTADGIDAHPLTLDVTDDASIAAAARQVEDEFEHLDVLVNNAGIAEPNPAPSQTTRADMRQVFDVNVFGVVAVTNAFLPLLRRAEAARIVNLSSEVGSLSAVLDPASPMYALTDLPYTASKTALNMVTGLYAKELAGTAIKVSAAIPGYCATDLNDHTGLRTADDGASVVTALATLPADAPTGQYWGALFATGQNGAAAW